MASRERIEVKQLKLTPEQMKAAIQRASENDKTWAVWKDPKAPAVSPEKQERESCSKVCG